MKVIKALETIDVLGRRCEVTGSLRTTGRRCWLVSPGAERDPANQSFGVLLKHPGLPWNVVATCEYLLPAGWAPNVTVRGTLVECDIEPFTRMLIDLESVTGVDECENEDGSVTRTPFEIELHTRPVDEDLIQEIMARRDRSLEEKLEMIDKLRQRPVSW